MQVYLCHIIQLSEIAFHARLFQLQTWLLLIQISVRDHVQSLAHQHLTWLYFLTESEKTPCSWTGFKFRSATLHRIQFRTCTFVPMPYFDQRPIYDKKSALVHIGL